MAITCICPHCRKQLSIADEHAGQPMRCPMCTAMFQSPALYTAQTGAAYSGPAPFWQNQQADPTAPEWPWLVGQKPPPAAPGAEYDWQKVQNTSTALDPNWHLVRRGLVLMSPSLIVAFGAAAFGLIFYILAGPEDGATKVVLMLAIPAAVMGGIGALLGLGLSCAAPKEAGMKWLAIGAALGFLVALMGSMFGVLLNTRVPQMEAGVLQGLLSVIMYLGFTLALVAGLGAGAAFLLFLRATADCFGNKRLGQRIFYFLFGFASSPVVALFVFLLFRATAALIGLDEGAYRIILTFAELSLLAIVLAGFLLMLRDVRATIERVVVPTRA